MGVPDFLKFVARCSPKALCRVPQSNSQSRALQFDYIFVDATNVDQTIGIDALLNFLKLSTIGVRKAVIFALDSQRSREGTMRHHRQSHTMIGDLDVRVQRMCTTLTEHYRRQAQNIINGNSCGHTPLVLISGRNVAGEADYKIMDLHRAIVTAHLLVHESNLPNFLFISEDSDILCAALCGPAPHTVSIATNLRSTTFDLCILRIKHVLEYIADCVEALKTEVEEETPEKAVNPPQNARIQTLTAFEVKGEGNSLLHQHHEETKHSGKNRTFQGRRKDGPNIATGLRIELTDSSSDDKSGIEMNMRMNVAETGTLGSIKQCKDTKVTLAKSAKNISFSQFYKDAGHILETTCVDLVFLFVLVMGNGANVPPLGRGVTKVDITSCWQAYCRKKYTNAIGKQNFLGRTLLDCSNSTAVSHVSRKHTALNKSENLFLLSLDCGYLYSILTSVHYADEQSRSPVEEEKVAARAFLGATVYATMRYLIGCNLEGGDLLTETFLDSRLLAERETVTPNLAAVLWVLSQQSELFFEYMLTGAKLCDLSAPSVPTEKSIVSISLTRKEATKAAPSLLLDVRENLISPASTSSWAIRGAGMRKYALKADLTNNNDPISFSGSACGNGRAISVASLVRQYAATHRIDTMGPTNTERVPEISTFNALIITWKRSVMIGVPHLQKHTGMPNFRAFHLQLVPSGFTHNESFSSVSGTNMTTEKIAQTFHPNGSDFHIPREENSVYSFELRRIVPVLSNTPGEDHSRSRSAAKASSSEKQAMLYSVLGISLDYARSNLGRRTLKCRTPLSDDSKSRASTDHTEGNRSPKLPRKEIYKPIQKTSHVNSTKVHQNWTFTCSGSCDKEPKTGLGRKERTRMPQGNRPRNGEK